MTAKTTNPNGQKNPPHNSSANPPQRPVVVGDPATHKMGIRRKSVGSGRRGLQERKPRCSSRDIRKTFLRNANISGLCYPCPENPGSQMGMLTRVFFEKPDSSVHLLTGLLIRLVKYSSNPDSRTLVNLPQDHLRGT